MDLSHQVVDSGELRRGVRAENQAGGTLDLETHPAEHHRLQGDTVLCVKDEIGQAPGEKKTQNLHLEGLRNGTVMVAMHRTPD